MAIQVTCPGCKKSFKVSEKFAGKQGPCPSCKAVIRIPAANAPAANAPAASEVVIHEPDAPAPNAPNAPATAAQQAKKLLQPITWQEPKLRTVPVLISVAVGVGMMVGAWLLGERLSQPEGFWLRAGLLFAVSIPICVCGYGMLRDEEAEPHRGRMMWLRAIIAATVYTALWAGYYFFVPNGMGQEAWEWFIIAPPLIGIGGLAGLACFDFDYATGCLHFGFYVLVTSLLGWLAHMPPWMDMPTPGS